MEQSSGSGVSEMISFGFDTEIFSLFWGVFAKPQPQQPGISLSPMESSLILPDLSSPLLQFLVFPSQSDRSNLYSFLHYTVVTVGVLGVVGVSSYCAYSILTKAREKLVTNTGSAESATSYSHPEQELFPAAESSLFLALSSRNVVERPDFLSIDNSSRTNKMIGLGPSWGWPASSADEEEDKDETDVTDMEPEYFGPAVREDEIEELDDEIFLHALHLPNPVSVSPTDSAYTSEYETGRPSAPSQPQLRQPTMEL